MEIQSRVGSMEEVIGDLVDKKLEFISDQLRGEMRDQIREEMREHNNMMQD